MNRIIRSRLSGIEVVLLIPLVLGSCSTCEECTQAMEDTLEQLCPPTVPDQVECASGYALFYFIACLPLCFGEPSVAECNFSEIAQSCIDTPEGCQEAFDSLVQASDTETE
jgi:hypothetical protein